MVGVDPRHGLAMPEIDVGVVTLEEAEKPVLDAQLGNVLRRRRELAGQELLTVRHLPALWPVCR